MLTGPTYLTLHPYWIQRMNNLLLRKMNSCQKETKTPCSHNGSKIAVLHHLIWGVWSKLCTRVRAHAHTHTHTHTHTHIIVSPYHFHTLCYTTACKGYGVSQLVSRLSLLLMVHTITVICTMVVTIWPIRLLYRRCLFQMDTYLWGCFFFTWTC